MTSEPGRHEFVLVRRPTSRSGFSIGLFALALIVADVTRTRGTRYRRLASPSPRS